MLKVLSAEIKYHLRLFLLVLLILPALAVYRIIVDSELAFSVLPTLILIIPMLWNIQRNKEHRDYRHEILPVSSRTLGIARLIVPVIFTAVCASLFVLVSNLISGQKMADNWIVWYTFLFLNLIFCIYFILRDTLLYIIRNNRFLPLNKETMMGLIMILVLILNILGIVIFLTQSRRFMDLIARLMEFNPFTGADGLRRLLITVVVTAAISAFTFSRRKSYLE